MFSEKAVSANLPKTQEEWIADCREHFDPEIASKVCRDLNLPQYDKIAANETLRSFLSLFGTHSSRLEFLADYVAEVRMKAAGKANCGCDYHAEDGIPCEHDLALLGK